MRPTIECLIQQLPFVGQGFTFHSKLTIKKYQTIYYLFIGKSIYCMFNNSIGKYIIVYCPEFKRFYQFDGKNWTRSDNYKKLIRKQIGPVTCGNCIHKFNYKLTKECNETFVSESIL